ncbi:hypothetical protein J8273_7724 [Carpediemonas membranifera]|uniref:Uncharacterized protein n=1 Tax=Carpediemonas membranifera TaxID=201153 RepID=A0A8J6B0L3_9EUKA|nr:hypothetical protein J8273_7724 [Carpediemonas membranifera]|eukprot:KAG9390374.1 hypothetical protein J8273_7724 [Carpediemonas membranifera]
MSRIKLFALLFLVTVAVCDTTSRTARISWTNPNVTRYLPTDIDYLLPKADGSGFDALSTSMDTNSYPWKFITFNFYRMVVEDLLTHPAADIIDIPVDQTFTFVTTLDTPTGAPVPNPTYEDNKPHIFVRNATDSFWSLNYHGSTLSSASLGRSTEEPMPMFCDGSSVFIYTGNEILKFGMDLTLQGNVTVDSTDVSFQQIMNYDKNGISKILIGANDADEAVIVSINTDFSAVVATNVVSIIDNVQMTDFAAPISASKNVAPDSIHYGFIDFDTTENNWVFTVVM